jgi:hypothetical protein
MRTHWRRRVPLLELDDAEKVFQLQPQPMALLVDVEGTLTEFAPSRLSVVEALARFDEVAVRNGLDLRRLHYLTNAGLAEGGRWPGMPVRLHRRAHKPFSSPPEQFQSYGYRTVVVGDQYLTDGLLAWRFGFSFGLVSARRQQPAWPQIQLAVGRAVSRLFFQTVHGRRILPTNAARLSAAAPDSVAASSRSHHTAMSMRKRRIGKMTSAAECGRGRGEN